MYSNAFAEPKPIKSDSFDSFYNIINNQDTSDVALIIDYSVEIFKNKPDSLESMYVLSLLSRVKLNNKIRNKIQELKTKYFDSLNDANSDIPEKLILLVLLLSGIDANSAEDLDVNITLCKKSLNFIKDNCQNKNYVALVYLILLLDLNEREGITKVFKEQYPNHKCIPLIELILLSELYHQKKFQNCIDECEIFIKNYKEITTPFGWKMVMDCYNLLIYNYLALNDYENAKKYYNLIETEAPKYDNLKELKNKVYHE